MEISYVFDINTKEGSHYSIQFDLWDIESFGLLLDIDVYSVTLFPVSLSPEINGSFSLLKIANTIFDFLILHDVILFYYCDAHDDIMNRIHKRRMESFICPQEFRSTLFNRLFERVISTREDIDLINKPIVFLQEEENISHYMNLITRSKNLENYEDIELTLHEYANNQKGK